ncbi:MAG: hypothetical protein ACXAC2_25220, partial [Candidatus Kariarchaeaceae archaeon]
MSVIFNSITVEILNSIPIVSNVAISPAYPTLYTNNSLDLSWSYTDTDLDSEVVSQMKITWYLNGLELPGLANLTSIPSDLVRKGHLWMVEVQVYDGTGFSIAQRYGPVIIQNTLTLMNNVYINNNAGTTNVTTSLILDWDHIDADGDGGSNNITWYRSTNNGITWIHQANWDNQTSINAGNLIKGESWHVRISTFDGDVWSLIYDSQNIAIINAVPSGRNLMFVNASFQHFFVEDEILQISYSFTDPDSLDTEQSKIMWFVNGLHQPQYDNLTTIPASETIVGQIWFVQIIPSDGYDLGAVISSQEKTIEDRPDILDYGITTINTTSEGHYVFWFDIRTNTVNPLVSLPIININIVVNNTESFPVTASSNGTHFIYEWKYTNYSMIGSKVTISVVATSSVHYYNVTSIITKDLIFDFIMIDTAPPRVKDVDLVFDDEENPTSIEFYVRIEEYGSGVDNATLYYSFVPTTETSIPASIYSFHYRIIHSDLLREGFSAVPLT